MKTTWTLELKGDRAQRVAKSLRRDLQSLQSALEGVDVAASRANATLARMSAPAGIGRRVAGERQVARAARATYETHRSGSRRVSQDERTQARIRRNVERARQTNERNATREELAAQRTRARIHRGFDAWRRRGEREERRTSTERARFERLSERRRVSATREMRTQHREQIGLLSSVGGVLGTIATVAAGITATAVAMVGGFAAVGLQIGQWIAQMAVFRESAVTTLGAVLGGRGSRGRGSIQQVGSAAFRRSQAIARLTPADERGALEASTQIAAAGYQGRQAERVNAASLDVQALRGSLDPTAQARFVLGLSQLHTSARARDEDIRQTAGAAGLSRTAVTRRAAAAAGVTRRGGETDLAYQNRIDAARRSGRITGAHAEEAVLQELQGLTGQRLGGFAAERGSSLGGAISNLEGSPLGMITGIGLENLGGLNALKASIFALGNALNGSSVAGQALQRALAGVLDGAGAGLAAILTPQNIERFVGAIATGLPRVVEFIGLLTGPALDGFMQGIAPLMESFRNGGGDLENMVALAQLFAESLGYIVGVSARLTVYFGGLLALLTMLGAGFTYIIEMFTSLPGRISDLAVAIGAALVSGIQQGISRGVATVRETVGGFAGSIVGTARDVLGINSPSRVFAELGGYTAQGFQVGLERGAPDVSGAVSGMLSGGAGAGSAGARGPVTIHVHVDGRGEDAEGLAETIARRVADLFAGDLDAAALGVG